MYDLIFYCIIIYSTTNEIPINKRRSYFLNVAVEHQFILFASAW